MSPFLAVYGMQPLGIWWNWNRYMRNTRHATLGAQCSKCQFPSKEALIWVSFLSWTFDVCPSCSKQVHYCGILFAHPPQLTNMRFVFFTLLVVHNQEIIHPTRNHMHSICNLTEYPQYISVNNRLLTLLLYLLVSPDYTAFLIWFGTFLLCDVETLPPLCHFIVSWATFNGILFCVKLRLARAFVFLVCLFFSAICCTAFFVDCSPSLSWLLSPTKLLRTSAYTFLLRCSHRRKTHQSTTLFVLGGSSPVPFCFFFAFLGTSRRRAPRCVLRLVANFVFDIGDFAPGRRDILDVCDGRSGSCENWVLAVSTFRFSVGVNSVLKCRDTLAKLEGFFWWWVVSRDRTQIRQILFLSINARSRRCRGTLTSLVHVLLQVMFFLKPHSGEGRK